MMLEDSQAALVLTRRNLSGALPASRTHFLFKRSRNGRRNRGARAGEADAGQTLRMSLHMYTSGSTGRPKGVLVPHRAVARLVRNTDFIQFTAGDVFLQLARCLSMLQRSRFGARCSMAPDWCFIRRTCLRLKNWAVFCGAKR